ncbi:lysylphosphatidylglycerol synthase transmembrane domain-containing protein [Jannaschia pohangensis]|uniref:Uncharacterized membrane protein YbhN, UPF0104 family n=1 Tax=Jannaschia pohangensis TaxID=390807 RepID=A0A1I3NXV0_9RHOB|nr:lysylphosphatidylglycerol synthase transmembrane domain-containing protein [Jannaschia pohangensis]SFJ13850.1 Uncharacterized membrane protein YbhN, UPF0104 family [Jannaschia pohangensis]
MKRYAGYALRLVVSLAILAGLAWIVDAPEAYARLRGMDLRWLALAVGCFTLVTVLMAWRWRLTAQRLGATFGFGWAVREYYLSQLVNLCLPGGMLGDAGRAWRTPRGGVDLTRAAHAVMIERLAGQVGVLAIGTFGVAWALVPGGVDWPAWLVQGALWVGLVLVLIAVVVGPILRRLGPVAQFRASLEAAFLAPAVVLWQLALSLAIAVLMIVAFWACARATGTAMAGEAALILVPLILTAMMIPVSVGGWGLREGAAAALFPIIGASASAGVAAGAAYGLALMIACLPGVLVPLRARSGSRKSAASATAGQIVDMDDGVAHKGG